MTAPCEPGPPVDGVTVASVGAVAAGALVALGCLAAPTELLEALVVRSGVSSLVNAAAPPLGITARMLLAISGGGLAAAVVWAVLVLATGERRVRLALRLPAALPRWRTASTKRQAAGVPVVRRGDSHPDAPPRPPILAERDLGLPFLSIVAPAAADLASAADRALPVDLDTALAALDPAAIPDVPLEPVRLVTSLATVSPRPAVRPAPAPALAPGERIDSVELGADVRDRPDTIESLLARLERGARRRPGTTAASRFPAERPPEAVSTRENRTPEGSLEETLGALRRLATRG